MKVLDAVLVFIGLTAGNILFTLGFDGDLHGALDWSYAQGVAVLACFAMTRFFK